MEQWSLCTLGISLSVPTEDLDLQARCKEGEIRRYLSDKTAANISFQVRKVVFVLEWFEVNPSYVTPKEI